MTDPQTSDSPGYTCPGRTMPQPPGAPFEGYVACSRAGHKCPPKVATVVEDDTHITTTWRCPCCGDHGSSYCVPKEWGDIGLDLGNLELVLEPDDA